MYQDPGSVSPLQLGGGGTRNARASSRVAMEERPQSIRGDNLDRRSVQSFSENRPMSIRSNMSARPGSMNNFVSSPMPVVVAEVEDAVEDRRISLASHIASANPAFERRSQYQNVAGNRETLTLSEAELANYLRKHLNNQGLDDIVTAEIIQQELLERQIANNQLDEEIAHLEAEVLSRELGSSNPRGNDWEVNDAIWRDALHEDKLDYMRPSSHKPYFSLTVFVVTTLTMVAEIGLNNGIEPFSVNPTFGPRPEVLVEMGAKDTNRILQGEAWRLFVPMILHAGILHLVFNLLGLWNIGVPMEREFGSIRIMLVYILSGAFGILMSCLFAPDLTSVGASGAIFGLFGAAWADLIQNWSLYKGSQYKMLAQLVVITLVNVILGLMPFLDNFAHVGGMVCGCILGLGILVQTRYYYSGLKKGKRKYQIALMGCSFLVLPALFISSYLVLFLQGPVKCDWCQYISCVPMPPSASYEERWWNCDQCSQGGLEGTIEPGNILMFTCPTNGEVQRVTFSNDTVIDMKKLAGACADLCLE